MATVFKPLGDNDVTSTRTLLHEAIPITGTIVSGTYGGVDVALGSENNVRNYSHGLFQSVYDYPHLSSSANHIFDLTFGYSNNSVFSASSNVVQNDKKVNIYNQMAQILVGHDVTGAIKEFQIPGGKHIREAFFVNFSRLITKDEIKKGSFEIKIARATSGSFGAHASDHTGSAICTVKRSGSSTSDDLFFTDSPAGEYAVLSGTAAPQCGLIFYQAGIAVLTASLITRHSGTNVALGTGTGGYYLTSALGLKNVGNTAHMEAVLTGSALSSSCNEFRHKFLSLEFNNTTELNSTIYFVRANHNEFNYSSNPTYLSGSKIRVKTSTFDQPVSYITTVGLYSPDNELLAVGKLSEPLKKTPDNELTLRVRLDY